MPAQGGGRSEALIFGAIVGQLLAENGKCLKQMATRDSRKILDSFALFDCGVLWFFSKIELIIRWSSVQVREGPPNKSSGYRNFCGNPFCFWGKNGAFDWGYKPLIAPWGAFALRCGPPPSNASSDSPQTRMTALRLISTAIPFLRVFR